MALEEDHYAYHLRPNSVDSHQAQPWALILIIHFMQPNTLDLPSADFAFKPLSEKQGGSGSSLFSDDNAVKYQKILIRSDILEATVQSNKGSIIGSATVTLVPGQYEYDNVVTAGDHAFIWMGNDISRMSEVVTALGNGTKANGFLSGLKFYGRVESVRKLLDQDDNGVKSIRFNLNFKSFSELNSQVYFNPYLRNSNPDPYAFYAQLSQSYSEMFSKDKIVKPQNAIKFLLNVFLGKGPDTKAKGTNEVPRSPTNAFMVPKAVGEVLGQLQPSKGARLTYVDVLNTLIGMQRYTTTEQQFEDKQYEGFVPVISEETISTRQRECPDELKGAFPALPDLFNNTALSSILSSLLNSALNEMYFTLRCDEEGNILPTLVARQIPFTTDRFHSAFPQSDATSFLELPRWVVDKGLRIGEYNIGTSDVARVNFVQFFGTLFNSAISATQSMAAQSSNKSFKEDTLDILRSGGRNMIVTSNVLIDQQSGSIVPEKVAEYATLVADWYMNGHLKLTGSMTLPGVPEPICVGDNLEHDSKVFHIEGLTHRYMVAGSNKSFNTSLTLVNGLRDDGTYSYTGSQSIADQNEQYGSSDEKNANTADFREASNIKEAVDSILNSIPIQAVKDKLGIV
jgi:hypothetical protein